MRVSLIVTLAVIFFFSASANHITLLDSIGVRNINGIDYILHKMDKGQGAYAVGRRYGVTIAELKAANTTSLDSLKVDQVILVPIKKIKAVASKEDSVEKLNNGEIIHTVAKGETLYRIGRLYDVSIESIQRWNNLENAVIKEGDKLVIKSGENKISQATDLKVNPEDKRQVPQKIVEVREEGIALIMEETSGDAAKSFALHRNAPVGTVIKVTNLMNGKSLFVKVVGNFADNENNTELIRISKLTAKQLGIRDSRTRVILNYHKAVPIE